MYILPNTPSSCASTARRILRLRPCRRPPMSWLGGCLMLFRGCLLQHRGCIWLHRGCIWHHRGCMWLHRDCIWLLFGCTGAAYGCTGVAFSCTGTAYGCTGAAYGCIGAADAPYCTGWDPRILRPRSGGGNGATPGGLQATKPDGCRTPNINVTVYPACKLQYTCRQSSQMVILGI